MASLEPPHIHGTYHVVVVIVYTHYNAVYCVKQKDPAA